MEVTLINGVLVLEPAAGQSDLDFSNQVSAAGYIQVFPPHNSSTDFTLSMAITVKEQDHEYVDAANPGQGIAEEVIHGSIGVKLNPIVEPDGQLLVENAGSVTQTVQADASGKIDFTINDASGGQAGRLSFALITLIATPQAVISPQSWWINWWSALATYRQKC